MIHARTHVAGGGGVSRAAGRQCAELVQLAPISRGAGDIVYILRLPYIFCGSSEARVLTGNTTLTTRLGDQPIHEIFPRAIPPAFSLHTPASCCWQCCCWFCYRCRGADFGRCLRVEGASRLPKKRQITTAMMMLQLLNLAHSAADCCCMRDWHWDVLSKVSGSSRVTGHHHQRFVPVPCLGPCSTVGS